MRALLAISLIALTLAPGVLAEDLAEEPMQPLDHPGDDGSHDSPALGVAAIAGVAAVAAVMRRRS